MSGVKRRTAYRKAVTDAVTDTFPVPGEHERVVQVLRSHGSNILEVTCDDGTSGMCILPTKYRKLIWIKRGDYLIAHEADDDVETAAGSKGTVRFRVEHVLGEPQVGFLKLKELWPAAFADAKVGKRALDEADREIRSAAHAEGASAPAAAAAAASASAASAGPARGRDDEMSSADYDAMLGAGGNKNRRGRRAEEEESSDEEESDEDEDEDEES